MDGSTQQPPTRQGFISTFRSSSRASLDKGSNSSWALARTFAGNSEGVINHASKHADTLRQRRTKSQSEDFGGSPEDMETQGVEVVVAAAVTDALCMLKLDALANADCINTRLDGFMSEIQSKLNQTTTELSQIVAAAQISPCSKSTPNKEVVTPRYEEDTSLAPSPQKPTVMACTKASLCFNAVEMPPSFQEAKISLPSSRPSTVQANIAAEDVAPYPSSGDKHGVKRPSRISVTSLRSTLDASLHGTLDKLDAIGFQREFRDRSKVAQILWLYLEDPRVLPGGRAYVRALILMILASCCANIFQTVESPPIGERTQAILIYVVDGILTAEVLVRFLVCPNRCSFWTHPYNVLDIVTGPLTLITRVLSHFVFREDLGESTARLLLQCWMPLAQMLRLIRRFESSYLIWIAIRRASEALPVLLYVLLVILAFFASLIYMLEPRGNVGSLPHAWWFTVVTLGTVGYGDITPVTAGGKSVTCMLVIISALYMAMPLGIVGQIFSEVWADRKRILLTQLARQRFKGLGFTARDIPAMFLEADLNMDGHLDIEEFTAMMKNLQFDTTGERAVELFKLFDIDEGGYIDDREFLSTLYPNSIIAIYGPEDYDG